MIKRFIPAFKFLFAGKFPNEDKTLSQLPAIFLRTLYEKLLLFKKCKDSNSLNWFEYHFKDCINMWEKDFKKYIPNEYEKTMVNHNKIFNKNYPTKLNHQIYNPKLPKEAQEIIKFYMDFPCKNTDDCSIVLSGLALELSPYLSNDLWPASIKHLQADPQMKDLVDSARNDRKRNIVDGISSQ